MSWIPVYGSIDAVSHRALAEWDTPGDLAREAALLEAGRESARRWKEEQESHDMIMRVTRLDCVPQALADAVSTWGSGMEDRPREEQVTAVEALKVDKARVEESGKERVRKGEMEVAKERELDSEFEKCLQRHCDAVQHSKVQQQRYAQGALAIQRAAEMKVRWLEEEKAGGLDSTRDE
eukprot:Hpha_TRINITY_DN9874_c1_g1::TRINITY_DN9874_c1_g1_i1::g.81629::m.81629